MASFCASLQLLLSTWVSVSSSRVTSARFIILTILLSGISCEVMLIVSRTSSAETDAKVCVTKQHNGNKADLSLVHKNNCLEWIILEIKVFNKIFNSKVC